MLNFLAGFATIGAAIFLWNRPLSANLPLPEGQDWHLAILFLFSPLFSAWVTVGVAKYFRQSRLFDTKSPPKSRQLFCGITAGILSMLIAGCGAILFDRQQNDTVIVVLSTILGTSIVIRLSRTIRPGHCARCDYDLRSSIDFGRCPECGLAI
jgi:hypothetical protein